MTGGTAWSNDPEFRRRDPYTGTYPETVTAPPDKRRRDRGDGSGGPPTDI